MQLLGVQLVHSSQTFLSFYHTHFALCRGNSWQSRSGRIASEATLPEHISLELVNTMLRIRLWLPKFETSSGVHYTNKLVRGHCLLRKSTVFVDTIQKRALQKRRWVIMYQYAVLCDIILCYPICVVSVIKVIGLAYKMRLCSVFLSFVIGVPFTTNATKNF